MAVSLVAGGGFLMAGPGTGCGSYLLETAFVTADFCFIFDCQNGIFGGTIDPCEVAPVLVDQDGNRLPEPVNSVSGPLLADCL